MNDVCGKGAPNVDAARVDARRGNRRCDRTVRYREGIGRGAAGDVGARPEATVSVLPNVAVPVANILPVPALTPKVWVPPTPPVPVEMPWVSIPETLPLAADNAHAVRLQHRNITGAVLHSYAGWVEKRPVAGTVGG